MVPAPPSNQRLDRLDAGVLAAIDSAAARRNLTRSAFIEAMAREAIPKMA